MMVDIDNAAHVQQAQMVTSLAIAQSPAGVGFFE
jgi:hypothetical protein